MVLIGSLSTIMLALCGFLNRYKFLIWLLVLIVYVTITCMLAAYGLSIFMVFLNVWFKFRLPRRVCMGLGICWLGLCAFVVVLHLCHYLCSCCAMPMPLSCHAHALIYRAMPVPLLCHIRAFVVPYPCSCLVRTSKAK